MKKPLLPLVILCISLPGLRGQTLFEKDLTADLTSLGVSANAMNSMLVDGNDVWMVPGQSWPNFRYFNTQGILRWNGTSLAHYAQSNLKLSNDSVYRLLSYKTDVLALTAAGIKRFDGTEFKDFTGISGLPTQKVYDLIEYGSVTFLATDKGLCTKSASGIKVYNTTHGLPESNCYKLVPLNGRVYGLTYSSVFEFDTTSGKIDTIFWPKAAGTRLFIAPLNGFLAISSSYHSDTFPYKTAFYKNGALYNLRQVAERCSHRLVLTAGESSNSAGPG